MTIRSPPHLKVPITVVVFSATGRENHITKNKRGSSISAITLDNNELGYSLSEEGFDQDGMLSTSPDSPHRLDRFRPSLHDSASLSSFSEMKSVVNAGPLIKPQRRGSLLVLDSRCDDTPTVETLDTLPVLPHRRAEDFLRTSSLRGPGGPIPMNLRSILPPLKPSRQISTDA